MAVQSTVSDPPYVVNLKNYGRGNPTTDHLRALETEMFDGPDRGAAVVLGSLVDRSLARLLETNGHQGASKRNFEKKIEKAFDEKLIGQKTNHDLTLIRHLRNQFAHSRLPIEFETPEVRAVCDELLIPDLPAVFINFNMLDKVSPERLAQAADKDHPRTRFFTSCNEIAARIYHLRGGADATDPLNQLP